jgi:hypothetical protein
MRRGWQRGRVVQTGGTTVPSRRRFLGIGIACAGPLLAGGPFLEATALGLQKVAAAYEGDPILDYVLRQTISIYRTAHSRSGARGEDLRAMATNIGLLATCVRSKGIDDSVDSELRRRVRDSGEYAVAAELLRSHDQLRARMKAQHGIDLPMDLFSSDTVKLSRFVERAAAERGLLKDAMPGLQLPMVVLAERIDARSAFQSASFLRPVARQKPGDDFGGYPEPNWGGSTSWGCGEWRQYGELLVALGAEIGIVAFACIGIPGCAEPVGAVATALAGAGGLVLYFFSQLCATAPEP